MATVVIGGQARKVGKTSVIAGLIAALPDFHWTAVKVSGYEHREVWGITEERDRAGKGDTSRFLAAGATRAFWVRAEPAHLAEAALELKRELEGANAMVESNSLARFLAPDVYLVLLDPNNKDFKPTAREFISSADAIIVHDVPGADLRFDKPVFRITPPVYITPEIVEFVRERITTDSP